MKVRHWSVFILSLLSVSLLLETSACITEKNEKAAGKIRGLDESSPSDEEVLNGLANIGTENEDESVDKWPTRRRHRRRRGLSPLEAIFAKQPSRNTARAHLRFLTSTPHMAGTFQDEVLGRWMQQKLKDLGADESWVDPIDAFLSYPQQKPRLALLSKYDDSKIEFEAKLSEDILKSDRTSDTYYRNHTFNGYSPSGSVKGKLVYANFGTPEDFKVLEKFNISVEGAIVLTRYGKCFRGLKAMNAQQRGAIGIIIYSDPHEDGYSVGSTYPHGPWRPASSVQRGSVQFNSLCAGDPRRTASNNSFEKCGYEPEDLYPKIPVLPISYEDALPLLRDLQGPFAPPEFVGALQVAYKLGPTDRKVWMMTKNRYGTNQIWNAFGLFKGRHYGTKRDRPLVIGNHRDAWVFGAVDPNSGTSCMLEVAKGFGVLKKMGWKPKRSIIFASWSGEELGLLGSTAWGEIHANGILRNAVAYLNVDIGVSGDRFQLETTATLARYIAEVLGDIPDPVIKEKSLLVRWDKEFNPLGTGSDYTVFIHHLGIPSADLRFTADSGSGKATAYGVYHSIYDSFSWMEQFGDPTFVFHEKMSIVWGICALRIADADILPFEHFDQAVLIHKYVEQIEPMVPDAKLFRELQRASIEFMKAARMVASEKRNARFGAFAIDSNLNDRLAFSERRFLHPKGLPLRKWFKHVIQAPDLYLGYSAVVLPGISQAFLDHKDLKLANEQAKILITRLRAVSKYLRGDRFLVLDEQEKDSGSSATA